MLDRLLKRPSKLAITLAICLVMTAAIVGLYRANRDKVHRVGTAFGELVQLPAKRDLATPAAPLRLSEIPSLILKQGTLSLGPEPKPTRGAPQQRLVLDSPEFLLDANTIVGEPWSTRERRNVTASDLISPLFQQLQSFGFDSLTIKNGRVIIQWGSRQETLSALDAEVSGGRRTAAGRTEPVATKGKFVFRGQTLAFDAALGTATNSGSRRAENPLSFNLTSELLTAQFDGRISLDRSLALVGPLEASTPKAAELARWLGLEALPANIIQQLNLKADVEWRNAVLALHTLSGRLDAQPMTGRFTLNHATDRAKLDGTLAFQTIDVTPFVAAVLSRPEDVDQLDTQWPHLSTSGLLARSVDFDLRLSAARPQLRGTTMKPLALTVIASAGKLQADLPAVEVGGTRGSIQVAIDTNFEPAPKTSVRSRFETAELGQFVAMLLRHDVVSGRAQAMVDLTGVGSTLDSVLRTATGRFQVTGLGSTRLQGDLRGLRVEALKASSPLPQPPDSKSKPLDIGWGQALRRSSSLERLEARGTVQAGVVSIESSRFEANGYAHVLTGQIALLGQTLNLLLAQQPRTTTDERSPSAGGSLTPSADKGSETDPIMIQGPWSNPSVRLDRNTARH